MGETICWASKPLVLLYPVDTWVIVSWDVTPEAMFAVLDDEYARDILEAARRQPMSGKELSEECDMSRATVSRRVNQLVDDGFLVERTRVDLGGHHEHEYEAILDTVIVRLLEEGFEITVELREDAVDRLSTIWTELRRESR